MIKIVNTIKNIYSKIQEYCFSIKHKKTIIIYKNNNLRKFMFFSYKWMIFFIFLLTFQIEASNKTNVLSIKDSSKKTKNFFLTKCI